MMVISLNVHVSNHFFLYAKNDPYEAVWIGINQMQSQMISLIFKIDNIAANSHDIKNDAKIRNAVISNIKKNDLIHVHLMI